MIHGKNFTGNSLSSEGTVKFKTVNAATQVELPGEFVEADPDELNQTIEFAKKAYQVYRRKSGREKAVFLREIASEIELLGSALIERACAESGLPEGRITGERGRTINQLLLFAGLLEEGSWVEAIIDPALPDRKPLPRPDLRRMLQPVGPVVIFTASNFPLAFSTAGGDTASALAAGNPVIIKAHPYHAGTNELIAGAIIRAAQKSNMPAGVFSSLNALGFTVGEQLVMHPDVRSVAFTGSFTGGMSLYRLAQSRPHPIPVFAEMGSINPVILLPQKIKENREALANTLAGSIALGAGQFCTNPGLVIALESPDTEIFKNLLTASVKKLMPETMLHKNISCNYKTKLQSLLANKSISKLAETPLGATDIQGEPVVATVKATDFLFNPHLAEEIFGPFSLLVECNNPAELNAVIRSLPGQLTTSVMGTTADLNTYSGLIDLIKEICGRVIFNGVPTGVEVTHAMQHGGPFPASTDSRFTSVGTEAVKRFVRPVSFQDAPDEILPDELKDANPLSIWRKVNGSISREPIK